MDTVNELVETILRTGLPLESADDVGCMTSTRRACREVYFHVYGARAPGNRHERRARASRQRRTTRALEAWVERRLDAYSAILGSFGEKELAIYERRLKRGPAAGSPWAPHALDTKPMAEARRSGFEIDVALRMHNVKIEMRARAIRALKRKARNEPTP